MASAVGPTIKEGTLTPFELQQLQTGLGQDQVLIIKFGAHWCAPCSAIRPICEKWLQTAPTKIIWIDIDVDESVDLYAFLKSKKMVNGIPVMLCYKKGNVSFAPDDAVTGSEPAALNAFFMRCGHHLANTEKVV